MRVLYSQENHRRLQVKGVEDPASIIPPPAAAASARVRSTQGRSRMLASLWDFNCWGF